jgi:hypothetical protein
MLQLKYFSEFIQICLQKIHTIWLPILYFVCQNSFIQVDIFQSFYLWMFLCRYHRDLFVIRKMNPLLSPCGVLGCAEWFYRRESLQMKHCTVFSEYLFLMKQTYVSLMWRSNDNELASKIPNLRCFCFPIYHIYWLILNSYNHHYNLIISVWWMSLKGSPRRNPVMLCRRLF